MVAYVLGKTPGGYTLQAWAPAYAGSDFWGPVLGDIHGTTRAAVMRGVWPGSVRLPVKVQEGPPDFADGTAVLGVWLCLGPHGEDPYYDEGGDR